MLVDVLLQSCIYKFFRSFEKILSKQTGPKLIMSVLYPSNIRALFQKILIGMEKYLMKMIRYICMLEEM